MSHVHTPKDSRIFVFGSNMMGIHGAGAARYAFEQLGAQFGVGEGPTGRAYALPTCVAPGLPLKLEDIRAAVGRFLDFARRDKAQFFVSEVGCGIAGFKAEEIAPLFVGAPDNIDLPPGWREIIREESLRVGRMYGADRDYSGEPPR